MIRICLKKNYLYEVENADNQWEKHYRYTYLDIGYKGKGNCGQKWLVCVFQEDYCELLVGGNLLWHSGF
jgi:hypothetical protein